MTIETHNLGLNLLRLAPLVLSTASLMCGVDQANALRPFSKPPLAKTGGSVLPHWFSGFFDTTIYAVGLSYPLAFATFCLERVQDTAWKFHVDTQPMKPTGPNGENYWLPVVDDATRLIEGIMLKNKSDASHKLTAFCERIKLLTGRYPGIWRMDGGSEFKEFIKWGEKRGMTFEITPPYTAEPNGTVERFGGHINDIQHDDNDDTVGFMPVSLNHNDSKPDNKQQQIVRAQPVQTPAQQRTVQTPVTPSTVHLPTIHGSVSTLPETPREKAPQQKAIVAPPISPKPPEETIQQDASQQATPIQQRRTDFEERLREITAQVSQLSESMKEVHEEADNIERTAITEQSSETARSDETTPSPERQRADYQYPFSSPIQQASVSPRREIIQAVESAAKGAASSNENTPVTARSEMSPSREIISIQSSPDPASPIPPPPRRSRRDNIGIPPDRYHDPKQKHLAVEYEKRDRDIQRAAKRAQAKESGGNNMTEGGGQGSAGPSGNAMAIAEDKVDIDEPFLHDGKPLHAKDVDLPSTYKQAQKSPFWPQWEDAMQKQLDDLAAKGTWSLILKPPKAKILPGQWRFTVKTNTKDEVYGFKARWVVCGNFQDKNDGETYAPVVAECMIKIVFTLIAVYGLKWGQVDFTAAYLNASRKDAETVYMRQPTGFEHTDASGDKNQWVCTLNQALFGLRDSAYLWNEEMDGKLRQIGFHPLDDDPCVYLKGKGMSLTIMMIHVDDFIIAAPSDSDVQHVVDELRKYYDMKDLGEPKQYLNCALDRDYENRTITMTQTAYVQKVLRTANVSGWKDTPLPAAWRETQADATSVLDDDAFDQYQSIVGMLNWLAVKTRPDIRFAVTRLQHRLAKPTFSDYETMLHVVKYLCRRPDIGTVLGRTDELRFYAHTDASHADWEDSKSTEGCIWYLAGSPVMWSTRKQTITANSTTVAEWSFMLPEHRPIEIHSDNINSQLLLSKKGGRSANRWLTLRWFFVKDAVAQGHVEIHHVDTKKNAADGFTKALAKDQFEVFAKLIGMI
ncbi:uncharacterized protein N7515_003712 [Penicillium bovifimosum]|uniref:Integrase catalytic domain-containing protein n=1 Tax=Penicillium bovifimosum TaxID=126998 RepID=A0A9W9H588_9EURO|nr:uncharacterized protein N7515_003712 [Penicillium bovifimosum]KAJ5138864.1 hypothetical protein N7515_003712 [Penicillium bovifimosum]